MTGYPFALVLSLITLGFIVQLLRTRRLREKYAGLWLVLVVVIIVLTIVPDIAFRLASALGVQTPANLLFAGSLVVLLLVSIQLSTEVSHLEEETRTLAERTAILGHRIEMLERRVRDNAHAAPGTAPSPASGDAPPVTSEPGDDRAAS